MDDSLNKIVKTVSKSKNKDLIVLALKAIGKFGRALLTKTSSRSLIRCFDSQPNSSI